MPKGQFCATWRFDFGVGPPQATVENNVPVPSDGVPRAWVDEFWHLECRSKGKPVTHRPRKQRIFEISKLSPL